MVRCFENFSGCSVAESVASIASHKPCRLQRKGTMEMWMFTMWCYERGLAGSPRVPLRFQLALRAPVGRCSDLTRPFFADSHWEAEPYQRLFLQQICDRVFPGLWRFEATSQDDSLFPISQVSESSVWARHSETLQTPDCAAAARAEAKYNFKTTISRSCLLQSTSVYYNLPYGDSSDAVLQWFSFIRHITHGKRMGIQRIWTD